MVVNRMEDAVVSLDLESSYNCSEESVEYTSHLTNRSKLQLNAETVNTSLQSFTDKTGIPIVVVVDEAEEVFGKTIAFADIFTVLIALVFLGVAVYMIVKAVKNSKNRPGGNNQGNNYNGSQNNYSGGYDNYSSNSNNNGNYW